MGYSWGVDAAVVVAAACGRCAEASSCWDGTAVKFRHDSLWTLGIVARGPGARAVKANTVLEIILREAMLAGGLAYNAQPMHKKWK